MVCKRLKGGQKSSGGMRAAAGDAEWEGAGEIIAETTPRCPVRKDKAKLLQIALQQL